MYIYPIGERIRAARTAAGLSREYMAHELDINVWLYKQIEFGRQKPDRETMQMLIKIFPELRERDGR